MEKRKWLWKRKSSERSPGESESSESFSLHSERYSDEQEDMRESPTEYSPSHEVTSKATITHDEMKGSVQSLAEKLSAALVNVSAKEDLVKQHVKVAEEAVAENEVATLKQQLEVVVQQNLDLEVKTIQLDGALKECIRQLRQARDDQEERISAAMAEKNRDWESSKAELEKRNLDLQAESEAARAEYSASADPNTLLILEALEKENSLLKQELVSRGKELEVLAIERDLSTQAAETASRLQLESIKKIATLETECRRLQSLARKSSPLSIQKSVSTSFSHSEYLTRSRSDSEERLNRIDIDSSTTSNTEGKGSELGRSDSWATISYLDQFKKPSTKKLAAYYFEIDTMDDFLEMERLAALPETKSNTPLVAPESASGESISLDNPLKAELDTMIQRVTDLEVMLEKLEAEKLELQNALDKSLNSLTIAQNNMAEAEIRLEKLQKELTAANEMKESLEFQLVDMEVESRTMSAIVHSLKAEIETERRLSSDLKVKCQELENELTRRIQEIEREENTNCELKIKQDDLAVAADKLAECEKTIASLGRQLQSLTTLGDFLIDTSNISGFARDPLCLAIGGEMWRLHSSDTFIPNRDLGPSGLSMENHIHLENGNEDSSRFSSFSPSSTNHGTTAKSRNSFGKFFC